MLTLYQAAPSIVARTITGQAIDLSAMKGKKVLIMFHRFSGCPVAQRDLRVFISRQKELYAVGIETIVFLHNTDEKVLPLFKELPGLYIIADRQKTFYKSYQAQFSWMQLLSFASWRDTMGAIFHGYFPKFNKFQGGVIGIPADFLVDEQGRIADLHYGKHFGDVWTAEDVLAKLN